MIAKRIRISTHALLAVLLAAGLAACGSASSSSTTNAAPRARGSGGAVVGEVAEPQQADKGQKSAADGQENAAAAGGAEAEAPPEPDFTPRRHHDSGGGVKQYETKGGDNSIQEYGEETSGADFDAAARVLHEYLDARAARAWGAACERLSATSVEELTQQLGAAAGGRQPSCAAVLAALTSPLPPSVLREAAEADVGAVRVEGERAFVLFHGPHGAYFMPMADEDGDWKVAAIAASPLP